MIVTRIPPSPTGHMHIGTARTALFNYLFAKHHGGHMVFRSEDTDQARSRIEFETEIIAGLKWLDLKWENDQTVFRQSERASVYRIELEKLISAGHAYESTEASKTDPNQLVTVVRLLNPNKVITFHDLIRGDITFDTTELGDVVIARSLDDALYHFTVVVDDEAMGVTHVIRGEDHISNTPRQILIQEALGYQRPAYAHLPLILAPDRSRLSKRHGAVSLAAYRQAGFTKEAVINYLALLGWNPGTNEEFFTLDELIERFDLNHVQKSGAVFNLTKFKWLNKHYLDQLSPLEFKNYLALEDSPVPETIKADSKITPQLIPLWRERYQTRADCWQALVAGEYNYFFTRPVYETSLLKWKKDSTVNSARPRLQKLINEIIPATDFSSPETIKAGVMPYAEAEGRGEVLWPLRVALSGQEQSPDPFTIASILGREETISRLRLACDKIVA